MLVLKLRIRGWVLALILILCVAVVVAFSRLDRIMPYFRIYDPPREQMTEIYEEVEPHCVGIEGVSWRFCRLPSGWVKTGGDRSRDRILRYEIDEFWLGDTTVTNADYERFDPNHERPEFSRLDDGPVTDVTWYEATEYLAWLSGQLGFEMRLANSLEWHYACLGGQQGPMPWGVRIRTADRDELRQYANLQGRSGAEPVGQYPANHLGLYDMVGNVSEWASDWWVSRVISEQPRKLEEFRIFEGEEGWEEAPKGLKVTKNCQARNYSQIFCECFNFSGGNPDSGNAIRGFRVATSQRSTSPTVTQ